MRVSAWREGTQQADPHRTTGRLGGAEVQRHRGSEVPSCSKEGAAFAAPIQGGTRYLGRRRIEPWSHEMSIRLVDPDDAGAGAGLAQDSAPAKKELQRPADWVTRADPGGTAGETLYFVSMPPGWHITTGPGTILYHPAKVCEARCRIEAEIFIFPGQGPGGYGIFLGGFKLDAGRGPDLRRLPAAPRRIAHARATGSTARAIPPRAAGVAEMAAVRGEGAARQAGEERHRRRHRRSTATFASRRSSSTATRCIRSAASRHRAAVRRTRASSACASTPA